MVVDYMQTADNHKISFGDDRRKIAVTKVETNKQKNKRRYRNIEIMWHKNTEEGAIIYIKITLLDFSTVTFASKFIHEKYCRIYSFHLFEQSFYISFFFQTM